jgi:hypothetical protein
LTTQSANTGWNTSCTQATSGFGFSQRGMTLNYAGNPNAAPTPLTKSVKDSRAAFARPPLSPLAASLPHQSGESWRRAVQARPDQ